MKLFRKPAVAAAALAFAAMAVGSAPAFAQGAHRVYARQHQQVQPRAYYNYVAPLAADPAPTYTPPEIDGWKDLH